MARRDVENVVWTQVEHRAVIHLDVQPPLDHQAGMVRLATLLGSTVPAQSPAPERAMRPGLEHVPRDGRVADLYNVRRDPSKADVLVGSPEVLLLGTGHSRPPPELSVVRTHRAMQLCEDSDTPHVGGIFLSRLRSCDY